MDNSNNVDKVQSEKPNVLDTNANFLYILTSNRLQNQLHQIESLDSKTVNLLGFSCTLMAILAATVAILGIKPPEIVASYISLGISVLVFILITAVSLTSYFIKGWHIGPNIQEAWEHSNKFPQNKMLKWAADSFTKAYNTNKKPIINKACTIKINIILLIIQIITSLLAITFLYFY